MQDPKHQALVLVIGILVLIAILGWQYGKKMHRVVTHRFADLLNAHFYFIVFGGVVITVAAKYFGFVNNSMVAYGTVLVLPIMGIWYVAVALFSRWWYNRRKPY